MPDRSRASRAARLTDRPLIARLLSGSIAARNRSSLNDADFFHSVPVKILVMTIDDESFLTAYMDGQLDAEQHQRVEAAVAASPHLAEKLRGLSTVRDMVAGLPHNGWVDVSSRVVQEIEARRRERGFLPHARAAGALGLVEFCRWQALLRPRPGS